MNLSKYSQRILFIMDWNIAGALFNLKDIVVNLNLPYQILKTVLGIYSSLTWTCQYLDVRSILVK